MKARMLKATWDVLELREASHSFAMHATQVWKAAGLGRRLCQGPTSFGAGLCGLRQAGCSFHAKVHPDVDWMRIVTIPAEALNSTRLYS